MYYNWCIYYILYNYSLAQTSKCFTIYFIGFTAAQFWLKYSSAMISFACYTHFHTPLIML